MRGRLLALLPVGLFLVSIAEIAVFVAVAHAIGFGWAALLMMGATLVGLVVLKREGVRGWRGFQAAAAEGRPAGAQVTNSLVGLVGALLLAIPGFVTAVVGLVLLVPPGRVLARRGVERFTERRMGSLVAGNLFGPRRVRVHSGEPVVVETATPAPRTPAAAIEGEVVEGEALR